MTEMIYWYIIMEVQLINILPNNTNYNPCAILELPLVIRFDFPRYYIGSVYIILHIVY